MRHRIPAAAITTAAILGLAACGPTTVTSTPDHPATGAKASAAPAKQTAQIGDSITLTGQQTGEKLTVTLKQWTTSVKASNDFETPDSGKTWVAAQFAIKNSGTAAYSDSPDNCTQVADASGQHFQPTIVTDITNGPTMTSDLKLAPGDTTLGWIVYEVSTGTKVSTVQFTPDSGMGDSTGQWTIK